MLKIRKPSKALYLFLILSLLLVLGVLAGKQSQKQDDSAASDFEALTYDSTLAKLSERITSLVKRAEQVPDSWTALEWAATAYLERAKLTGSYKDYAAAEELIQQAFTISGLIGGPHLTRAKLNYSLHRLDVIAPDLDVIEKSLLLSTEQHVEVISLRADVAFQKGNYEAAFKGYQQALNLMPNTSNLFRLAVYYWKTGDFEQAEGLINQAEVANKGLSAQTLAFLNLHRGLLELDQGNYDYALAHYQSADTIFPNWWLVKEHIAEIHTIEGDLEEAKLIYEKVVEATANPEFMDALAGIALEEGNKAEAKMWLQKSKAIFEQQLTQFPEASYGHALGHFLEFTNDANRLMELAEANHTLRPNGEAQTLLAQAYFKSGHFEDARDILEITFASPWRSAELHATAAFVFEAMDNLERSKLERQHALTINPNALANLTFLNRF